MLLVLELSQFISQGMAMFHDREDEHGALHEKSVLQNFGVNEGLGYSWGFQISINIQLRVVAWLPQGFDHA